MEQLSFRAPGTPLPWRELRARIAFGRDRAGPRARFERASVDGLPWHEGAGAIPAGALVQLHSNAALGEPERAGDRFFALVARPAFRRGRLPIKGSAWLEYGVESSRGEVAELRIEGSALIPARVLRALAASGLTVLGDLRRGGVLVEGGLRFAPESASGSGARRDADDWWPAEPVFRPSPLSADGSVGSSGDASSCDTLVERWPVSAATARVVGGGHPWFLPDAETASVEAWRPGSFVEAVSPSNASLGVAMIEGPGRISARIWSRAGSTPDDFAGPVEVRVARALARRASMQERGVARALRNGRPFTDTIRLIHGEADGLPGIAVERLGPILRMIVTSEGAALALADRVAGALLDRWSGPGEAPRGLIEVLHLRDEGPAQNECVRWWRPPVAHASGELLDARGRLLVHEGGLAYSVDPGLGEPEKPRPGVGLFLDQRDNRHRLARFAKTGGRWLNLFAHTGAFSVALLAAGAGEVVSVDLSKRYLEWLDENLALNREAGVDAARHQSVRGEGRRYVAELPRRERFAGIVLDPPTAAAAGRRHWSTDTDLAPLIEQALARLEPGGVLLVSRNHRRARQELAEMVRAAARARGIELASTEPADPGPDFPRLRGFREGDSFRGVLAIRA